jgi:hypothetical protein
VRADRAKNVHRFYLIGWLPRLFGDGAVASVWGRKGSSQRRRLLPFGSLEKAWPVMREASGKQIISEQSRQLREKYIA